MASTAHASVENSGNKAVWREFHMKRYWGVGSVVKRAEDLSLVPNAHISGSKLTVTQIQGLQHSLLSLTGPAFRHRY